MGDFHHQQFLASMAGGQADPNIMAHEVQQPHMPGVVPLASPSVAAPFSGIGYFTAFHDPLMFSVPKTQRSRRKSTSGLDTVKHRRTRSGCFMCRSRRVKCDETRPICERCKKGNRECIYPDLPTSKAPGSQAPTKGGAATQPQQMTSPESSTGAEELEPELDSKLEPIPDEDEDAEDSERPSWQHTSSQAPSGAASPNQTKSSTRQSSETPSLDGSKSSPSGSPATSSSMTLNAYQLQDPSLQVNNTLSDWSHLPADFQYYLNSFCQNITHHHYCLPNDPDRFFYSMLPNIALQDDALLNAVVGFSAYHETLTKPDGKVEDFLKYYNKSVTLLLNSLKRREPQTVATIVTVLQLATIEEYLGDWINVMGHQKAALQILTNLFTPDTVMLSPVSRTILAWYQRFDVFVAVMGGFKTALPREWFTVFVDFCREKAASNPEHVEWKLEEGSAFMRLVSMDMSMLYAQGNKGEISPQGFSAEHDRISRILKEWKANLDPALRNPALAVTTFPNQGPLEPESDIVNPYTPGILYEAPLTSLTLLMSEWHSISIMHKCQSPTIQREQLYAELREHSYEICQIFEAVERWPKRPNGMLMMIQACLAISALFLPQDARHHFWIRRKFALMETLGYIHPITLRSKMSELFRDPSCVRWWLPNEEGYTPILQSIRTFADERNAVAVSAQVENLREVRHVFAKMQLSDDNGDAAAAVAASGDGGGTPKLPGMGR
ncbi:hypothetical protein jhhlp_003691 [Lomentospora prolificans]|uniref:Zn(2)-C6 fungal-type domain-containing protein n=1 Tax=Lomentospora prolificans TaxID=41688 RepID=A0A2N3N9J7_9PEZI|nr:hypothetical protein jhhlp_003691 [Lomentospora prolificans]